MGLLSFLRGIGKRSKCKTENSKYRLATRAATINKRRGKNRQAPLPLSEAVLTLSALLIKAFSPTKLSDTPIIPCSPYCFDLNLDALCIITSNIT